MIGLLLQLKLQGWCGGRGDNLRVVTIGNWNRPTPTSHPHTCPAGATLPKVRSLTELYLVIIAAIYPHPVPPDMGAQTATNVGDNSCPTF